MGTMLKISLLYFFFTSLIYIANVAGIIQYPLLVENDLFSKIAVYSDSTRTFDKGSAIQNVSGYNLEPESGSGTFLVIFDNLKQAWNAIKTSLIGRAVGTAFNIFTIPYSISNYLLNSGAPNEIVVPIATLVILPAAIILMFGFISMLRGKDV